ncbi:2475_t:CDS:2 [Funneliformis mosseae]|uniref:2475_t:CDS:1 n=1 Tax=Funneliformis mosseae TaxID=27381 RepID=A0A9N9BIZ3_FUNMO|nr:2475_t:CDS:2 [Funneliformis mosseae]
MSSNFSRSRSKNTSPSSSSQSLEIAGSSRETQIKTTKEIKCDDLEELEQQITFSLLNEVYSSN